MMLVVAYWSAVVVTAFVSVAVLIVKGALLWWCQDLWW